MTTKTFQERWAPDMNKKYLLSFQPFRLFQRLTPLLGGLFLFCFCFSALAKKQHTFTALKKGLDSRNLKNRYDTARLFVRNQNYAKRYPKALPVLVKALKRTKHPIVKGMILRALGTFRGEKNKARPVLLRHLHKEQDHRVQSAVALALGNMRERHPAVMKALKNAYQRKHSKVQPAVIKAFESLKEPIFHILKMKILSVSLREKYSAIEYFIKKQRKKSIERKLYPYLVKASRVEKDPYLKSSLFKALSRIKYKKKHTFSLLLQELERDKRMEFQADAVLVLSSFKIRNKRVVRSLLKAFSRGHAKTQACAIHSLWKLKYPTTSLLKMISKVLKSNDARARGRCAFLLSKIVKKDKRAIIVLLHVLRDTSAELRGFAVDVLSQHKSKRVLTKLLETLNLEESSKVRLKIARALAGFGFRYQLARIVLVELLGDLNEEVRWLSFRHLKKYRRSKVLPLLLKNVRHKNVCVRSLIVQIFASLRVKEAIPHLIKALDANTRLTWSGKASWRQFQALSRCTPVQKYARRALIQMGPSVISPLLKALQSSNLRENVLQTLLGLKDAGLVSLFNELSSTKNPQIKIALIEALSKLPAPKLKRFHARKRFTELTGDKALKVRQAAFVALRRFENKKALHSLHALKKQSVAKLIQILRGKNVQQQLYAIRVLRERGVKANRVAPVLFYLIEKGNLALSQEAKITISWIGKVRYIYLKRAFRSQSASVRKTVLHLLRLQKMKTHRVLALLKKGLFDKERDIRTASVEHIAHLASKASSMFPSLSLVTKDKDATVRKKAISALSKIVTKSNRKAIVLVLKKNLQDARFDVRSQSAIALTGILSLNKRNLPVFLKAASYPDGPHRVARALCKAGTRALPVVRSMLLAKVRQAGAEGSIKHFNAVRSDENRKFTALYTLKCLKKRGSKSLSVLYRLFTKQRHYQGYILGLLQDIGSYDRHAERILNTASKSLNLSVKEKSITVFCALRVPRKKRSVFLRRMFKDSDSHIRLKALQCLSDTNTLTKGLIIRALQDKSIKVKEYAVERLFNREAIPKRAIPILRKEGQSKAASTAKGYQVKLIKLYARLAPHQKNLVPVLMRKLRHHSKEVKLHAIESLGAFGSVAYRAVPRLISMLKRSADKVQIVKITSTLAQLSPESVHALPVLRRFMNRRSLIGDEVFSYAIAGVAPMTQLIVYFSSLSAALDRSKKGLRSIEESRIATAKHLGDYLKASPVFSKLLVKALHDKSLKVQITAMRALAQSRHTSKPLFNALVAKLKNRKSSVRKTAIYSLARIGFAALPYLRSDSTARGLRSLNLVTQLLSLPLKENKSLRKQFLQEIHPHKRERLLLRLLYSSRAKKEATFLLSLMKEQSWVIRYHLTSALPEIVSKNSAVEFLKRALKDSHWCVRLMALHQLRKMKKSAASFAHNITKMFEDADDWVRKGAVRVSIELYPASEGALNKAIKAKRQRTRLNAVRALALICNRPSRAFRALKALQRDRNKDIRRIVHRVLNNRYSECLLQWTVY